MIDDNKYYYHLREHRTTESQLPRLKYKGNVLVVMLFYGVSSRIIGLYQYIAI